MNRKLLYALWGGMFIVCAGLGFIPEPQGAVRVLLGLAALAFFVPPALLTWGAVRADDRGTLRLMRNFSALSLMLTLVVLVLNFLFVLQGQLVGNLLYYVLIVVSSPMVCMGHWGLSLFLWACLLMVSLARLRK